VIDIPTESFCERCGTKFSFGPPPKPTRLSGLRVLSRGLKNYVLTDGSSLTDVLSTARADELRRSAGNQLEAFHETFNFCMTCRQYTCSSCWNAEAGRCISCEPLPVTEVEAAVRRPVVQRVLDLVRLRYSEPAFSGRLDVSTVDPATLRLTWHLGDDVCELEVDLRSGGASITTRHGDVEHRVRP